MRRIGVVGAGIVGVQLARMLQIRGAHVTLLDDNEPGSQTSIHPSLDRLSSEISNG